MPITRAYSKAGSPLQGLANPVINGGFDIWQRGTSGTNNSASGSGCNADRWTNYLGSGAITVSRQATGDTTNLPNLQYCARVQRNSGNTAVGNFFHINAFESVNSIPFAGKTVTLSFYARAGANFSASSNILTSLLVSGTGTDQNPYVGFTGSTNVAGGNNTLTTTWQRFAWTGTVATNITQLAIQFYYATTGTAGANDYFEVTGVQVDIGSYTAATAPEFRRSGGTLAGELAACQRYYWKSYNQSVAPGTVNADEGRFINIIGADSSGYPIVTISYPVTMRTAPTITPYTYAGTSGKWQYLVSGGSATEYGATASPIGDTRARITSTPSGVGSSFGVIAWSGHIVASAEL